MPVHSAGRNFNLSGSNIGNGGYEVIFIKYYSKVMTVTRLSRFQLELDSKQTVSLNIRLAGIGFARKVNVKQLEANH